jgi:CysZ protein
LRNIAILSQAFALAAGQLRDRAILAVIVKSVLLTALLFAALLGIAIYVGQHIPPTRIGDLIAIGLVISLALLGWLAFRTIAMMVMGLFSDAVVDSVEGRHYAAKAAHAMPLPWQKGLRLSLTSLLRSLGYNVLASPLYIVLLLTGLGTLIALILVNGLALGKDLEAMVASRHPEGAIEPLSPALRNMLGIAVAVLFSIPFINIFAPIIGAAMAVHVLHLQKPAFQR